MEQSPYIITILPASITLEPKYLNNNIYTNIKKKLIDTFEGKCYKNYGYIEKIYEIKEQSKGIILHENPYGSVIFEVKFSCKLWNPIKNTFVVGKLEKYNRKLMNVKCGAIKIIIEDTQFNSPKFSINRKNNLVYNEEDEINIGAYLRIMILSKIFNDGDDSIVAKGYLDELATDEEINKFEKSFMDTIDE